MKRIGSLPRPLRPREKLLASGVESLTIEELLSVIFITGTKSHPVSQIATTVAKVINTKQPVTKEALRLAKLSPSKIAQVLAVVEIGKRLQTKTTTITSAAQIFAHCYEVIHAEKETLLCFYINARGELIKKEIIAVGFLNRVNLLPREIFHLIKELPVAAIILVHNHPSGVLEPSNEDILFTKRVKAAADILGVKLLDHLIVGKSGWKKIKV